MAEHQVRREHLRQLVDRRRREHVARAQRAEQRDAEQHQPEIVRGLIAVVHAQRVLTVLRPDSSQAIAGQVERLAPAHLDELAITLDQRPPEPVRIVVQVGQRGRLWADVAPRDGVVLESSAATGRDPSVSSATLTTRDVISPCDYTVILNDRGLAGSSPVEMIR